MIKSIKIDNFKSLVNFQLQLSDFNCLVGLNGAGKTTVLQGIDFLAQLMKGDVSGWLKQRQWDKADINSKLSKKLNIDFEIQLVTPTNELICWAGSFNRNTLNCTRESIVVDGKTICKVNKGQIQIAGKFTTNVIFDYEGSIFSQLKLDDDIKGINDAVKAMTAIKSLDLISPALLRKSHSASGGQLGLGGEKLSSFLHEAGKATQHQLMITLQKLYPQLDKIETKALHSGLKELSIEEHFNGRKFKSNARHINDGMLRLMAILSQLTLSNDFMLFDEIENGINPELIKFLMDTLVVSKQQVLLTTHSPMILNFLEDEVAKKGVIYLYKADDGSTQAIRLFDIPSIAKKLNVMGPGEAFIDTDLTQLYQEIVA